MVLRMGTVGFLNSAWLCWRLSAGFTDSLRESSTADSKDQLEVLDSELGPPW